MLLKPQKRQTSSKALLVFLLIIIVIGSAVFLYWRSGHQQAVSVVRKYMYYEKKGDYGTCYQLLHSSVKTQMNTYSFEKTLLSHFSGKSFNYKIKRVNHYRTWHPKGSNKTLKDVYRVEIEQFFNSSFGKQILITYLYVAKDKSYHNYWRILWNSN